MLHMGKNDEVSAPCRRFPTYPTILLRRCCQIPQRSVWVRSYLAFGRLEVLLYRGWIDTIVSGVVNNVSVGEHKCLRRSVPHTQLFCSRIRNRPAFLYDDLMHVGIKRTELVPYVSADSAAIAVLEQKNGLVVRCSNQLIQVFQLVDSDKSCGHD